MGSIARYDGCDSFIKEFESDICKEFDYSDLPGFSEQYCGTCEREEVVKVYVRLHYKNSYLELTDNTVFYDPEYPSRDDQIERLADLLDMEFGEIEKRFDRAGLI